MTRHPLSRIRHLPAYRLLVRNVPVDDLDTTDRAVLAIGTDYPPRHLLDWHRHRRAQFLFGASGVMQVETDCGTWTVPQDRAVLIPPRTRHRVTMLDVSTRSLYIEPGAAPWFPRACRVVDVRPLLRELLLAAVDVPLRYDHFGRDGALMTLLLHEIADTAPLPLELPLPGHPELRALCQAFLDAPDIHDRNQAWAHTLHVSTRTLDRMFSSETGMSSASWRRRACVLAALPELGTGRPVAAVAARLGYASPASFTAMFTKLLGTPPSSFSPR